MEKRTETAANAEPDQPLASPQLVQIPANVTQANVPFRVTIFKATSRNDEEMSTRYEQVGTAIHGTDVGPTISLADLAKDAVPSTGCVINLYDGQLFEANGNNAAAGNVSVSVSPPSSRIQSKFSTLPPGPVTKTVVATAAGSEIILVSPSCVELNTSLEGDNLEISAHYKDESSESQEPI